MRRIVPLVAACLACISAPASAAVTLQTNGTGQLTGATGISVRDARFDGTVSYSTYDVEFVEGTCTDLFGGCDENSDFTMVDGGDALQAQYAADALLGQVLTGSFDSNPALTLGCGSPFFCEILIPYDAGFGFFKSASAFNSDADDSTGGIASRPKDFDTTNGPVTYANTTVYARFTLAEVPSVPEPTTWTMMLIGFAGIGFAMRRRSRFSNFAAT